jgi:hypothetical protein
MLTEPGDPEAEVLLAQQETQEEEDAAERE